MHQWGDENVDWGGINDAAHFIGSWLRDILRLPVVQWKEKYGTVRVYMHGFSYNMVHNIWKPGHVWNRYPYKWMWTLDIYYGRKLLWPLNKIMAPINMRLYRWRYKKAVQKWPHLRREILCAADFPELLEGL